MHDSLEKLFYFFTPTKFRDKIFHNKTVSKEALIPSDLKIGDKMIIVCNIPDEYPSEDKNPLLNISKKLEDTISAESKLIDLNGNKIISTNLTKEQELNKSYNSFARSLKVGVVLATGVEINKDKIQPKDIIIHKPTMVAYQICFDGKMCEIIEERDIVVIAKNTEKGKE